MDQYADFYKTQQNNLNNYTTEQKQLAAETWQEKYAGLDKSYQLGQEMKWLGEMDANAGNEMLAEKEETADTPTIKTRMDNIIKLDINHKLNEAKKLNDQWDTEAKNTIKGFIDNGLNLFSSGSPAIESVNANK